MNNIIALKSNYEIELKKLSQENSRLSDELKQQEIEKVKSIEEAKYKLKCDHY